MFVIPLPIELQYPHVSSLLTRHYQRTLDESTTTVRFDWTCTRWALLPEIVTILAWSSKLTHRGIRVEWGLPDAMAPPDGIDDLRFTASLALGIRNYARFEAEIGRLRQAVRRGQLYPGTRRDAFEQLRRDASQEQPGAYSAVDRWLRAEESAFAYVDLLAYLERYAVFERAGEVGITFAVDPRTLAKSKMPRGADTPCMELRPILSRTEVGTLVDRMCDQEELTRFSVNTLTWMLSAEVL
jgi:hypothetical protein